MEPYTRIHTNLRVSALTKEGHDRTCGYWFTVTAGPMAHTAFRTRAGFTRWLRERNLVVRVSAPLTAGTTLHIIGTYKECSYLDEAAFYALRPILTTAEMSNGDYTLGLITEDEDGIRTVHYLNPNVKTRIVFDYARTREIMS